MNDKIEKSIKHCCEKSSSSGSTFYPAFRFLKSEQRKALNVIYNFCRMVDDAVDEAASQSEARRRLAYLRAGLREKKKEDLWPAFNWVRERYGIPLDYCEDLITGAETDIGSVRIMTLDELNEYCYRVAGTVGMMTLHIFEAPVDEIKEQGLALGQAYQYTNILRDVAEDRDRARCYIPQELLKNAGALKDWHGGQMSRGLHSVLQELGESARLHYQSGIWLLEELPFRQRLTLALMSAAYSGYLLRLQKSNFDVWSFRPRYTKKDLPGLFYRAIKGAVFTPEKCLLT